MNEVDKMIVALHVDEQPGSLPSSPILDGWEIKRAHTDLPLIAIGRVSGSEKFPDGRHITTSMIGAIDSRMRWIATQNTVYRLGWQAGRMDPVWRAAAVGWRDIAISTIIRETGQLTFSPALASHVAVAVAADLDWPTRRLAVQAIGDELGRTGRLAIAKAWWLIATDGADAAAAGAVHEYLANAIPTEIVEGMGDVITGWQALGIGMDFGQDVSDPIAAAPAIGRLWRADRRRDSLELIKNDSDILDEVFIDSSDGIVVLKAIGGVSKSSTGKEVAAEFKDICGKRVPLKPVPDLTIARKILVAEFPYAERLIDILLADLAGREDIKIRPTLILGSPGCGKTRLIRKLGAALDIYVGRYDGAGAEDNCFGGTARRWSSGEPCWPMTVIRAAGHANPIIHVDEIDKSAEKNRNGSLARALLPMCESESAARFPDPYIHSDIDLSHVSFLMTANDDAVLPLPLRDRLRILRMPPITMEHVPLVACGIVKDLATERGLDRRWVEPLDGDEIEIARRLLSDGSVRRLRAIIERLLAGRESGAMRH